MVVVLVVPMMWVLMVTQDFLVVAAMMLLGSGSSDSYYYSSSFEQVTVTSRGEDGQPRVETRQQRSVKTNIPQRALGETGVNAITGY